MDVSYDLVDGARIRKSKGSLEIVRPALVYDIPLDCSVAATDPSVLLKALEVLPPQYSLHPNASHPAILEDYEIASVRDTTSVIVHLLYRLNLSLGNPNDPNMWIKMVATQNYNTETYSTADGSRPLQLWYKSGHGDGGLFPPVGARPKIGKARRVRTYKVMKVTGRMYYNKWLEYASSVEAAEECINSDSWGSATRGQWLFLGPIVTVPIPTTGQSTSSLIATVELNFTRDKLGHFPLMAWLNERREHPKDTIAEETLRADGLPAYGRINARNGKALASVYPEINFTGRFVFTP